MVEVSSGGVLVDGVTLETVGGITQIKTASGIGTYRLIELASADVTGTTGADFTSLTAYDSYLIAFVNVNIAGDTFTNLTMTVNGNTSTIYEWFRWNNGTGAVFSTAQTALSLGHIDEGYAINGQAIMTGNMQYGTLRPLYTNQASMNHLIGGWNTTAAQIEQITFANGDGRNFSSGTIKIYGVVYA